jgi:hypothetical protein
MTGADGVPEAVDMEEFIRRNAEPVIQQVKDLFGVTLRYDEESVAWLDNYIV